MFVIKLTFKVTPEKIDAFAAGHKMFLEKYYQKKLFIASGPQIPKTGGVIIMTATDKEQVENIIQEDPFYYEGLADYEVIEFDPTSTQTGFESFI